MFIFSKSILTQNEHASDPSGTGSLLQPHEGPLLTEGHGEGRKRRSVRGEKRGGVDAPWRRLVGVEGESGHGGRRGNEVQMDAAGNGRRRGNRRTGGSDVEQTNHHRKFYSEKQFENYREIGGPVSSIHYENPVATHNH
jgi:hypothetical protein